MDKICLRLCWIATIMVVINLTTATYPLVANQDPPTPLQEKSLNDKDCTATESEFDNCCTDTHLCGIGEGDCDTHKQCEGLLGCGANNCKNGNFLLPDEVKNRTKVDIDCCVDTGCGNYGQKFVGTDIAVSDHSQGKSLRDCQNDCVANPDCEAFNYQTNGICFQQSAVQSLVTDIYYISAEKSCITAWEGNNVQD